MGAKHDKVKNKNRAKGRQRGKHGSMTLVLTALTTNYGHM
jgi:hypothetical protein